MSEPAAPQSWRDIFYTCRDGLRLYARHYPAAGSARRPVVCLAGLTRNARDFHMLSARLADARGHRRDVYCLDMRGRGRSEHDPDWKNYTPLIEALDVLDFLTREGLHDVTVIGTSRGGLIAMVLAVMRPTVLGAVVLNDIGPVVERNGLARIAGYVGRIPLPASWEEATGLVREMSRRQFPAVKDEEWTEIAKAWYNDSNGLPTPSYDPAIANSIRIADIGSEQPEMWDQFAALTRIPAMVIRGESSDLLAPETVARMAKIHPDLVAITVPKQGHAPLLRDEPTMAAIAEFLSASDGVKASASFGGRSEPERAA